MPQSRPRQAPPKSAPHPSARCCPVCGKCMEPRTLHRTEIDVCLEHGVWLDRGELETISRRLRLKKRFAERHPAAATRKQGREEGSFWGPLAFLCD